MFLKKSNYRLVAGIFSVLLAATIMVLVLNPNFHAAWDAKVYRSAMQSLREGHDPYQDGIALQRAFHGSAADLRHDPSPYSYVYSPLTLPLLRWLGRFPLDVVEAVYWLLYAAGACVAIWVGMQFAEENEREVLSLIAPAVVFFPGLLMNNAIFVGNVAYVLYGLVLGSAMLGWRHGRWGFFYAAVLAASCCKTPILSLLVLPVLSETRQWLAAGVTGAAGVALFAVQPHLWPKLFHNYLEAVELQFSYNHDFGLSPAGLLADALFYVIPYQRTSKFFYLFYAALFTGILFYLRRRFLTGKISFKQWAPLMLIGVVLLNPRIKEYDVAALAIPMALVAWRFCSRICKSNTKSILLMVVLLAIANACAPFDAWLTTECIVLMVVFASGVWDLWTVRNTREDTSGM